MTGPVPEDFGLTYAEPDCPKRPHRGPAGPNEDIALCMLCGAVSYAVRPWGETYGWHADDCSLPIWHLGGCAPGGAGHPAAPVIRGFWPTDPRSPDFCPPLAEM